MLLMRTGDIDRPTLLRLAAECDADPRSVAREIQAIRGESERRVRGRAGERIRAVLASHGYVVPQRAA